MNRCAGSRHGNRTAHCAAAIFAISSRAGPARGLQLYDSFAPGAVTDWLHLVDDGFRLLNLFKEARPVDMLLLPDLLWDNRGAVISRLWETGLHRVAIFHDAIALRQKQSRIDSYFCARGIRALAEMDAVICISEEAEDDLLHYWSKFRLPPTSTFVVPWPVPFTGERPQLFPNFHARELLYVARIEEHKNHLRLLGACELLWRKGLDFSLRLIGCKAYPDTAWNFASRLRWLRHRRRRVRWDQHVSDAELLSAYRQSSFTVFASLREGFGLPMIESLWHARPVVCGGNGALGEIAAAGGCSIAEHGKRACHRRGDRAAADRRNVLREALSRGAIPALPRMGGVLAGPGKNGELREARRHRACHRVRGRGNAA